ncbi:MAG: hypothetical protein OXC63_11305, partial [Aestuariivita sp.]|nr:hypothetical protein [Aestuariivita sp.]
EGLGVSYPAGGDGRRRRVTVPRRLASGRARHDTTTTEMATTMETFRSRRAAGPPLGGCGRSPRRRSALNSTPLALDPRLR